jgi:TPR repeat protein
MIHFISKSFKARLFLFSSSLQRPFVIGSRLMLVGCCIHPSSLSFSRSFSSFCRGFAASAQGAAEVPAGAKIESVATNKEQLQGMLEQALGDVRKKAEAGDPKSQVSMGEYLETKIGGQDLKSAAEFFKKAAGQNDAAGQYHMGRVLMKGLGVGKDEIQGLRYLNLSAGQGYDQAQYYLGVVYFDGTETIREDRILAARYFKLAADQGLKQAQNSYGFMLLNGDGVEKNVEEEFK